MKSYEAAVKGRKKKYAATPTGSKILILHEWMRERATTKKTNVKEYNNNLLNVYDEHVAKGNAPSCRQW